MPEQEMTAGNIHDRLINRQDVDFEIWVEGLDTWARIQRVWKAVHSTNLQLLGWSDGICFSFHHTPGWLSYPPDLTLKVRGL